MERTIMDWNIGQAYIPKTYPAGEKITKEFFGSGYSVRSIPQICETIKDLKPDFVLLQEVANETHLQVLMERTGYLGVLGPPYIFEYYHGHMAILSRSEEPDTIERMKEEHAVLVHMPKSNLTLVSLHLDSYDRTRGNKQLAGIASRLPTTRTIVGGDFNEPVNRALNVFKALDKPFVSGTRHAVAITSLFGIFGGEDVGQFDGILASPDLQVRGKVLRKYRWGTMDHFPIFATVNDAPD